MPLTGPVGGIAGRSYSQTGVQQQFIRLALELTQRLSFTQPLSPANHQEGIMDFQEFQSCQVADVGVAVIVAVVDSEGNPIDIRSAATKTIKVAKPDHTMLTKTAVFVNDGSDGQMMFLSIVTDFDKAGTYEIQGVLDIGGSAKSTAASIFSVNENLPV